MNPMLLKIQWCKNKKASILEASLCSEEQT
jgi:hypothetical protein